MDDVFIQNAQTYAVRQELQLAERLGYGIHGIIFVAENKSASGKTAVKVHRESEPYQRERAAYELLREIGVSKVRGFNVPQFIRADDELRVIEMTIVTRPFVLDFAGAWLDAPPSFSDEIWADWETEKSEQFESRWAEVKAVLDALENWGIYMVDVSPSNVAFAS
jgi:hypothetical protein